MEPALRRLALLVLLSVSLSALASAQEPGRILITRATPDLDVTGPQWINLTSAGRSTVTYVVTNHLDRTEPLRFDVVSLPLANASVAARVYPAAIDLPPNGSAEIHIELVAFDIEQAANATLRLHVFGEMGGLVGTYEIFVGVTQQPAPATLPPSAFVALGIGALGLSIVAAFRRVDALRWIALLALAPLYTRLAPASLLDQEKRETIYRIVLDEPGIRFSAILERSGLPNGVVVHHLRQLERHRLLVSRREGTQRRFAPSVVTFPPAPPKPITPMQTRVLELLSAEPLTQRQIAEALGLTQQGANRHVKALERRGLLSIRYQDGEWRCHATTVVLRS